MKKHLIVAAIIIAGTTFALVAGLDAKEIGAMEIAGLVVGWVMGCLMIGVAAYAPEFLK